MRKNSKETTKIKKRKKLAEWLGFKSKFDGQLRKGLHLNCGCSQCKTYRFFKKYERKVERHKAKQKLKTWENF